jgi:hypothetical protein
MMDGNFLVMHLFELRDRILMLPALENRLSFLQTEIQKTEVNVARLLRQYERESRDVKRIQKDSFSSFLLKMTRQYDDKLEKEQREEINAKLAYDRIVTHLNTLVCEKNELASRIAILRVEEQTYHAELTNRRCELAEELTETNGLRYAELENERKAVLSQISEIKEALNAAANLKFTVQNTLESLKNAENWATYDIFTRGSIISHIAKYSHIDQAEHNFHTLSSQLHDLKSELRDVHDLPVLELTEISSSQRAIDFWLDNIFTDLSIHSQIKDNIRP